MDTAFDRPPVASDQTTKVGSAMEEERVYCRVADPSPEVEAELHRLLDDYTAEDPYGDFDQADFEKYMDEHASKALKAYQASASKAYEEAERNGDIA